ARSWKRRGVTPSSDIARLYDVGLRSNRAPHRAQRRRPVIALAPAAGALSADPSRRESAATRTSWVKISQSRALSGERLGRRIGTLSTDELIIEGLFELVGP